ncbi:MAG: hypothetical protein OQK74_10670 [Gammaproteobacteria bacterium]|nr:hypothetical protein [Gammaproteobacteria bacterium]
MSEQIELKIVIDPSLVEYFEEGMRRTHIDYSTATEIAEFLAAILNDTMYPIVSKMTSEQEIHLNYRPRSFADPIF